MSDTIVMPERGRLAVMRVKVPEYLRTLAVDLFINDVTPTVTSVYFDFVHASFPGANPQDLTDFGDPYINADHEAESDSAVHTWTCTGVPFGGSQTVYGWFAYDLSPEIAFAARFVDSLGDPDPITLTGPGQSISIQIFFEDGELKEEI